MKRNATKLEFLALVMGLLFMTTAGAADEVVDASYKLNAGDKLQISIWDEEALSREVSVAPDGAFSYPLIGVVPAAGKTSSELAAWLKPRLAEFVPDPVVTVTVLSADGNEVYVVGQVAKPGRIHMLRQMDVMQALSIAGGLTPFAVANGIHILRRNAKGEQEAIPFAYGDVEDGDDLQQNIWLISGDVLVVP